MRSVRITRVGVAHPANLIDQSEAAARIGLVVGAPRQAAAIARGSQISQRSLALSPAEVSALGSIEARNRAYERLAPALAAAAARLVLTEADANASHFLEDQGKVDFLVTTSCTGYMVPGLDVVLAEDLG